MKLAPEARAELIVRYSKYRKRIANGNAMAKPLPLEMIQRWADLVTAGSTQAAAAEKVGGHAKSLRGGCIRHGIVYPIHDQYASRYTDEYKRTAVLAFNAAKSEGMPDNNAALITGHTFFAINKWSRALNIKKYYPPSKLEPWEVMEIFCGLREKCKYIKTASHGVEVRLPAGVKL